MSYNSRAPHKSRGLLKPLRTTILSPFHVIRQKPTEPYPLLMATGICDIQKLYAKVYTPEVDKFRY